MNGSNIALGVAFGASAGAMWGLVFLAPELVSDFSPLSLTVGRCIGFGGLSILFLIRRWHSIRRTFRRDDLVEVAKLAFVGNILYYVLLATAVQLGGIAVTSLIIGFLPVAVTIVGSRERQAVPLRKLSLSLALCAGGVLLIGWRALIAPAAGSTWESVSGLLCAIGALASWTWYAVRNSRWLIRVPHLLVSDWNILSGIMTGGLALLLLPVAVHIDTAPHDSHALLRLTLVSLGIAFCASIIGNACWNRMSRLLPLTLLGQMILFETLFALIYGLIWEARLPHLSEGLAFGMVACSVISCLAAHR